jgi:excisionase family DNA binding protein
MRPGCCRAKAHRPSHLGYGGRRVLVSRKWTAKDLTDHRHDRRAHVLAVLGRTPDGQPVESASDESSTTAPPDDGVIWSWPRPPTPMWTRCNDGSCAPSPMPPDGAWSTAPPAMPSPLALPTRPPPERTVMPARDPLLSIDQAAELLGTGPRFPRRLVAEPRIRFVHVGRHVRITESAVREFIGRNTVEPVRRRRGRAA